MNPGGRDDTIPAELEKYLCAEEPIHLLGTVQSYGFLMVVDSQAAASSRSPRASCGTGRALQDAGALISRPLSEWAAAMRIRARATFRSISKRCPSHPVRLPWRPRFEQTGARAGAAGRRAMGMPRAPKRRAMAVLEWLPLNASVDEMRRQKHILADFGEVIARLRRVEGSTPSSANA
jgi:hypothetical protein